MNLLFNKEDNEATANKDLKELLGAINADFKFKNLLSDVKSATRNFIKIFGKDFHEYAYTLYEDESESEILYLSRYCIILDAVLKYLPKNDVAITNNGRTMYRDESTVAAFEYQINNQNEAIERSYYKALDELFSLLEEENPAYNSTTWKDSDAYKKTLATFIPHTDAFDEFFEINNRYLLYKLTPGIKQCMELEIKPRLSQELYDAVLNQSTGYNEALRHHCQSACVYYALSWGIKRLRVTLFPEGVLQQYKSDTKTIKATKPSEKMEAELAAQEFFKDALAALSQIEAIQKELNTNLSEGTLDPILYDKNDNYFSPL